MYMCVFDTSVYALFFGTFPFIAHICWILFHFDTQETTSLGVTASCLSSRWQMQLLALGTWSKLKKRWCRREKNTNLFYGNGWIAVCYWDVWSGRFLVISSEDWPWSFTTQKLQSPPYTVSADPHIPSSSVQLLMRLVWVWFYFFKLTTSYFWVNICPPF